MVRFVRLVGVCFALCLLVLVGRLVQVRQVPWMLFTSWRDGNTELYAMRMDGSDLRRITNTPADEYYPRLSPDGKWILFETNDSNGIRQLYRMRWDGSQRQQITHMPAFATHSTWLPNDWILFESEDFTLYRIRVDGTGLHQLHRYNLNYQVSPDGRWLAFTTFFESPTGNADIYRMRVDGSDTQRLTDTPSTERVMNWTSDSQWLFFSESYAPIDIYRMRADGTHYQPVIQSQDYYEAGPFPSPDGKWIAFLSNRSGWGEVYRMRADGTDIQRLTDLPERKTIEGWSPDSQSIIFTTSVDDYDSITEIYRIGVDGSGLQNLSNSPSYDQSPYWLPTIELAWHKGWLVALAVGLLALAYTKKLLSYRNKFYRNVSVTSLWYNRF